MSGADMPDLVEWRAVLRAERHHQDRHEALEVIVAVADELESLKLRRRYRERCGRLARGLKLAAVRLGSWPKKSAGAGPAQFWGEIQMPHVLNKPQADFQYWRAKDRGPTARELLILRRIGATGGLQLIFGRSGVRFALGDGMPVRDLDYRLFLKFESLSWITPDPQSPGLFPELPAQRYLVSPRFWP